MKAALDQGHQFLFRACKDRKVATGPTADGPCRLLKSWARVVAGAGRGGGDHRRPGGPPGTDGAGPDGRGGWRGSWCRSWCTASIPTGRRSGCGSSGSGSRTRRPTSRSRWSGSCSARSRRRRTEELRRYRDWYACRPLIEEFHQVEKSGCGEEALRFQTAEALLPMLGVLAIVAVRVLQLRWWGRDGAEAPAASASTAEERQALKSMGQRIRTARRLRPRGGRAGRVPGPHGGRRARLADVVARLSAAPGHRPGRATQSRTRP